MSVEASAEGGGAAGIHERIAILRRMMTVLAKMEETGQCSTENLVDLMILNTIVTGKSVQEQITQTEDDLKQGGEEVEPDLASVRASREDKQKQAAAWKAEFGMVQRTLMDAKDMTTKATEEVKD